MIETPGGPMAGRPLHFIWICDCSGSMQGDKIEALNFAIREAIPKMQDEARNHHNAQIQIRAITFSSGAQWHIAQPTPIEQFKWTDLTAGGVTDMGRALSLLAEQLQPSRMPDRGLPPVLVLLSDGQPTDDFNTGLNSLMAQPWGKRAVRIAIAIGHDADHSVLQKFIADPERQPLQANNPDQLVKLIRWASTLVVSSVIKPPSQPIHPTSTTTDPLPPSPHFAGGDDVW